MKIISYNVNGIRAAIKKGFLDWLQQANQMHRIQETKAQKEQLNLEDFEKAGYPYRIGFQQCMAIQELPFYPKQNPIM